MKINSRGVVTVAAMAVMLVTTGCKKKDAVVADTSAMMPPAPEAPAALHVTDVSTGKGLTADNDFRDGTSDFGVRDTIYVLVKTDGASKGSKLDAKWTYNGKTVKQSSQNISPSGGEKKSEFHMQKASAWPKGNYKVEVMLDGAAAGSKDFTIK